MERGDVKEAIERLEQADEVVKRRLSLRQVIGEQLALVEARELLQRAITKLLPYQEGGK